MVELDSSTNGVQLTEHEAELYDRQIRLWGLESQKRLRASRILIIGLSGFGAEIAKNIILAGVKSVLFLDDKELTVSDGCSQFLAPTTEIGKNRAEVSLARARALNPMVCVNADCDSVDKKDRLFFRDFDVVVATGLTKTQLETVNTYCREANAKFFAGDVWGMTGYSFADLQEHEFVQDVYKHKTLSKPGDSKVKSELVTSQVKRQLSFKHIKGIFEVNPEHQAFKRNVKRVGPGIYVLIVLHKFREEHNRDPDYASRNEDFKALLKLRDEIVDPKVCPDDAFQHIFSQISPTAAIVGGVLAQEIIKTVSQKDSPLNNFFIFDPETCRGYVETF